ncbi:hypothetical protein [Siccibacter colletis]|uniref:hypothetical protein n=1 Tax=Siccibacter colletis TaxID=1505757 RepID=UPI003CE83B09
MKLSYRITKYTDKQKDSTYLSHSKEWTSFYDVGSKVTLQEYIAVEDLYANFLMDACKFYKVTALQIVGLEINESSEYEDMLILDIGSIPQVVRDILREKIWAKLVSPYLEFHFGYDFYMYFLCEDYKEMFIATVDTPLTVDACISPYLN